MNKYLVLFGLALVVGVFLYWKMRTKKIAKLEKQVQDSEVEKKKSDVQDAVNGALSDATVNTTVTNAMLKENEAQKLDDINNADNQTDMYNALVEGFNK